MNHEVLAKGIAILIIAIMAVTPLASVAPPSKSIQGSTAESDREINDYSSGSQSTSSSETPSPSIEVNLTISDPPALGQYAEITLILTAYADAPNLTAQIMLSQQLVGISGQNNWTGSLAQNESAVLSLVAQAVEVGNATIQGIAGNESRSNGMSDFDEIFLYIGTDMGQIINPFPVYAAPIAPGEFLGNLSEAPEYGNLTVPEPPNMQTLRGLPPLNIGTRGGGGAGPNDVPAEHVVVDGCIYFENQVTHRGAEIPQQSPNPYPNNMNYVSDITARETNHNIRWIHFPYVEIEKDLDRLWLWDPNHPANPPFWSTPTGGGGVFQASDLWVPVDAQTVRVSMTSDNANSRPMSGFKIDAMTDEVGLPKFPTNPSLAPARWTYVEIWDNGFLGYWDSLLWRGITGLNGCFESDPIYNRDGWPESGNRDIYIVYYAGSKPISVRWERNWDWWKTYGASSEWDVRNDVPDGVYIIGDWAPGPSDKAWGIYDMLIDGWDYMVHGPAQLSQDSIVDTYALWAPGSHYDSVTMYKAPFDIFDHHHLTESGRIEVNWEDEESGDALLHEYGHHMMWVQAYNYWSPCTSYGSHRWNEATTQCQAWSEGWADFFPIAARTYNNRGDNNFDWVHVAGYGPLEWTYDPAITFFQGDQYEDRIARSLYDIFDDVNDGTDVYQEGGSFWQAFRAIWGNMGTQQETFSQYWGTWTSSHGVNSNHYAKACIYQNRIDYDLQSPGACCMDILSPDYNGFYKGDVEFEAYFWDLDIEDSWYLIIHFQYRDTLGGDWQDFYSEQTNEGWKWATWHTASLGDGAYEYRPYVSDLMKEGTDNARAIWLDNNPPSVTQISPSNGFIIWDSPTFTWTGTDPPWNLIETYHIQISDTPTFQTVLQETYLTGTSYTPYPPLDGERTYYWRVRAKDTAQNWGSWSPTWSVTVKIVLDDVDWAYLKVSVVNDGRGKDILVKWSQVGNGYPVAYYLIYRARGQLDFDDTSPWADTRSPNPLSNLVQPLRREWLDIGAADPTSPNYAQQYYYMVIAYTSSGYHGRSSNTAGKWTHQFPSQMSTMSVPFDVYYWLPNPVDTLGEMKDDIGASWINYIDGTGHWASGGYSDPIRMGEMYFLSVPTTTYYTFTGLPGAMVNVAHPDGFTGYYLRARPNGDAWKISAQVSSSSNDVTLIWASAQGMTPGTDHYYIYTSAYRDGFFVPVRQSLLTIVTAGSGPTQSYIHQNAALPGTEHYYLIKPIKVTTGTGTSTYSIGVWTKSFNSFDVGWGLPLKTYEYLGGNWLYTTYYVGQYCNWVPLIGAQWFNTLAQHWVVHYCSTPIGTDDTLFTMIMGIEAAPSTLSSKFSHVGV